MKEQLEVPTTTESFSIVIFILLMVFIGVVTLDMLSIVRVIFPWDEAGVTIDPKINAVVNADTIPIIANKMDLFKHTNIILLIYDIFV